MNIKKIPLKIVQNLVYFSFNSIAKIFLLIKVSNFRNKIYNKFIRAIDYISYIFPTYDKLVKDIKDLVFFSKFIKKGDLCYDIGANYGIKTRTYLLLKSKVISVEPQKNCVIYLKQHLYKNKNVKIIRKAIGSKTGRVDLFIFDYGSQFSSLSKKFISRCRNVDNQTGFQYRKKETVSLDTLDNLIDKFGVPKLCKIDVEGYELEVLKGLTKKIPYIIFEFHTDHYAETKKCIERILSLGPALFNYVLLESYDLKLTKWSDINLLYRDLDLLVGRSIYGDIYVKYI